MIGRLLSALALFVVVAAPARAQAPRQAESSLVPIAVSLGPLGTGRIVEGDRVGSVGLFHSDLATVMAGSPAAVRYARVFDRDQALGRPLVLLGVASVIGGFWAYVARGGQLGMGGREATAVALGSGVALYGVNRLTISRRALQEALQAFNRDRQQ